jgi:hypothetical protein
MDLGDKRYRLLQVLSEKTGNRQVRWEPTPIRNRFQCMLASGSVDLHRADAGTIAVIVLNDDGQVVDRFEQDDVRFPLDPLYEQARLDALNAEEVFDTMIGQLEAL